MKEKRFDHSKDAIRYGVYHNTNKESGLTLVKSEEIATSQEDRVYSHFLTLGSYNAAPHQLLRLFRDNTPITSIRRAVTNLEKQGKLAKTSVMVMGSYGKMVHTWKLKNGQIELFT